MDLLSAEKNKLAEVLQTQFGIYLLQIDGSRYFDTALDSNLHYKIYCQNQQNDKLPKFQSSKKISIIKGTSYALPFKPSSIDVVILPHTLEIKPYQIKKLKSNFKLRQIISYLQHWYYDRLSTKTLNTRSHILEEIDKCLVLDGKMIILGYSFLGCLLNIQSEILQNDNIKPLKPAQVIAKLNYLGYKIEHLEFFYQNNRLTKLIKKYLRVNLGSSFVLVAKKMPLKIISEEKRKKQYCKTLSTNTMNNRASRK